MKGKVLSIELGKEMIRLCQVKKKRKELVLYHVVSVDTPEGSVADGAITDLDAVANAIKAACKAHRIKEKNVVFSVNSTRILSKTENMLYLKPKQIKEELGANLAELFSVQPAEYEPGYLMINVPKSRMEKISLMAYAVPKLFLERYYELGSMLGLQVQAVDYAANSIYQLMKLQAPKKSGVFCHIGNENTVLCIMEEGRLLFQRVITCGKADILNAVMEKRAVPREQAEACLKQEQLVHSSLDGDEVTEVFRYLINHIQRIMDYFLSANDKNRISEIYLMGEGSHIQGVKELFASELGMQVRAVEESKGIKSKCRPKLGKKAFHAYMPAVGAALAPLELERPQTEEQEKKRAGGYGFGLMLAIAAAAAMVLYPYFKNQKLLEELAVIRSDIALIEDAQLLEEGYNSGVDKIRDMKGFYEATQSPNGKLSDFISVIESLQPSGVQLDNIAFSEGTGTFCGTVQNKEELAAFLVALKEEKSITELKLEELVGQSFRIKFSFAQAGEEEA